MNIDHAAAEQAYDALIRGVTMHELAQAWGTAPSTIYSALHRHGFEAPKRLTPPEHVEAQRQAGIPPDLYAARAAISLAALRNYASNAGTRLALSHLTETRAWWAEQIEALEPRKAQSFCIANDIPVHLLAQWYHKIKKPDVTLLWGFSEIREVTCDMFHDVARFANQHAPTHTLGRGSTTTRTDIRVASEAYRHSVPYCA